MDCEKYYDISISLNVVNIALTFCASFNLDAIFNRILFILTLCSVLVPVISFVGSWGGTLTVAASKDWACRIAATGIWLTGAAAGLGGGGGAAGFGVQLELVPQTIVVVVVVVGVVPLKSKFNTRVYEIYAIITGWRWWWSSSRFFFSSSSWFSGRSFTSNIDFK